MSETLLNLTILIVFIVSVQSLHLNHEAFHDSMMCDISQTGLDAIQAFKNNDNDRYIIFQMDEQHKVTLQKTGPKSATWTDFAAALPVKSARYALYKYEYNERGNHKSALLLITWTPVMGRARERFDFISNINQCKAEFKDVKAVLGLGSIQQFNQMTQQDFLKKINAN